MMPRRRAYGHALVHTRPRAWITLTKPLMARLASPGHDQISIPFPPLSPIAIHTDRIDASA